MQNWPNSERTGKSFNIWIGSVGLMLNVAEYRVLIELVRNALKVLRPLPLLSNKQTSVALN